MAELLQLDKLHLGDCIDILPNLPNESVDLIYMDPPFNSGRDYGEFDDRFGDTSEYIDYIEFRVSMMWHILKKTGSFYLHCDTTASHYLKVMLDKIFGIRNFRNEIVWCYTGASNAKRHFPKKHDTILFYSKTDDYIFNHIRTERTVPCKSVGFAGKITEEQRREYDEKGKCLEDWWVEKPGNGLAITVRYPFEHTGYPTQKPLALLERIVRASSNPDDIVLDPCFGSGTSLVAAKKLGRRHIGIDMNENAHKIANERLEKLDKEQRSQLFGLEFKL